MAISKITTAQKILEFKNLHGEEYSYKNTIYTDYKTPLKITCNRHGDFSTTAKKHLNGFTCPTCKKETAAKVKFSEIHGTKYNYDKVIYKNSKTNITITCEEHGDFYQTPSRHQEGQGCSKCYQESRRTPKEGVIKQFKEVHSDTYDYSKVEYEGTDKHVIIICSTHGEFKQRPHDHLANKGCPDCQEFTQLNTEEIIEQFKDTHGELYDYSKVEYISAHKKIKIRCAKHGYFKQTPTSHKNGSHCPKCSKNYCPTTKEVIKRFKNVHKDKYNYSKVDYTKSSTPVTIICSEHGEFKQVAGTHWNGSGCPKCAQNVQLSTKDAIKQFKKVHGDTYDYSNVVYSKNDINITIGCSKHGDFEQTPNAHKQGKGCAKCAKNVKLDTKSALERFNEKFDNKYTYNNFEYIKAKAKITIECPIHGLFETTSERHWNGRGCPVCRKKK